MRLSDFPSFRRFRHYDICDVFKFNTILPRWYASSTLLDLSSHDEEDNAVNNKLKNEISRLKHLRNIGILAHVDAGKTTVTERMLELAGVVRNAGSVDDGNTVTDYLPQERERGITIQSAAISFDWGWHNNNKPDTNEGKYNDNVSIQLIDTPGHVDFSVEVNRSVAVLDGAVLVLDAVAGVQAQTETVWRAINRPSLNNHVVVQNDFSTVELKDGEIDSNNQHSHEPLPCLALINKMDKVGCQFGNVIQSIREKLEGANPIAIQRPLFCARTLQRNTNINKKPTVQLESLTMDSVAGDFVGIIDLIDMRAIIWPDRDTVDIENWIPDVIHLLQPDTLEPIYKDCTLSQDSMKARFELIESLAEIDAVVEESYLSDEELSKTELRAALRRVTLARKALPVMAAAALKGKGLEPVLDNIADFLPSPLDRSPPLVNDAGKNKKVTTASESLSTYKPCNTTFGHPLHASLLALAFKVVHMKGRGSGDGRVVFARVYSGKLRDRDQLQVITPPPPGGLVIESRIERIGGMLELSGGRFDNVECGEVMSGEVCALVGLKTVVTGDTLVLASEFPSSTQKQKKGRNNFQNLVYLAGFASPKPVLTVRLETETSQEQNRLSEALKLMAIEDPSLLVEETESTTLLSGLGELHIEVTLDRLCREFGLHVMVGSPSVSFRETVKKKIETPGGLVEYDRTIGGTRLQAAVHLVIEPNYRSNIQECDNPCILPSDPVVKVGSKVRNFLGLNPDLPEDDLLIKSKLARALIQGCQGALKRGSLKSSEVTNVVCHIQDIDAEGGLPALHACPGALQAASANAVAVCLKQNESHCSVLEPTVSVEIIVPNDMLGSILSDLNSRRGRIEDVVVGEKALVRGDVPLAEILGYATSIRSLTGGEGVFTSEYRGYSFC